jgi:hypothetical protein
MPRRALLFFVFFIILFFNCFPARRLTPPDEVKPEKVIETLRVNEKELNSEALYLEFKFKGKGKKFSTESEIFYREPESFSIYFKSSSHLNIFKSIIEKDSVFFYLPEKNEYYLDSYENFSRTKGWEWGIELKDFLNLVIGKNGLGQENLKFVKKEKNKLVYVSADDFWEKRFWVDHRKNRLSKSEWKNKITKEFLRIEFKRYKDFYGRELPGFMEIKIPSERETLKVLFKKRKINLPLSRKRFEFTIPHDASRVWLKLKD